MVPWSAGKHRCSKISYLRFTLLPMTRGKHCFSLFTPKQKDTVHGPPSGVLVITALGILAARGSQEPASGREERSARPAYRQHARPRIREKRASADAAPGERGRPHAIAGLFCVARFVQAPDLSLTRSRSSSENGTCNTCLPGPGTGPGRTK